MAIIAIIVIAVITVAFENNFKGVHMKLIPYSEQYTQQINDYVLKDDYYSKQPKIAVEQAIQHNNSLPILAFNSDMLVSFCVLDNGIEKTNYTMENNTILLKSFSTDSRYVGHGFASQTLKALPEFIKNTFSKIESVVLGVNQDNLPAIKLYKKCGFKDTGRKYLGEIGWQLIFVLPLK
ncbi:GNAT family N-acetyltransferase [Weissella thailandensis]|uniref:GNAT family N-acetyltransferase n=1 Tax=Weissella thailandensis TaxID=89061 RepID=UPI0027E44AED|nr:GNAT family N-acetyltransferase [Weissella thailandensis]